MLYLVHKRTMPAIRYFFLGLFEAIYKIPLWWYGENLASLARTLLATLRTYGASLSLRVWVKNLFVPMYGLSDIQSRLISFVVRLVQILGRSFLFGIWSLLLLVALVGYLALPLILVGVTVYELALFLGV